MPIGRENWDKGSYDGLVNSSFDELLVGTYLYICGNIFEFNRVPRQVWGRNGEWSMGVKQPSDLHSNPSSFEKKTELGIRRGIRDTEASLHLTVLFMIRVLTLLEEMWELKRKIPAVIIYLSIILQASKKRRIISGGEFKKRKLPYISAIHDGSTHLQE